MENNDVIKALPDNRVNSLSSNLKKVIEISTVKHDALNRFVDVNVVYSFIKDDAMLLLEFQDLIYSLSEGSKQLDELDMKLK